MSIAAPDIQYAIGLEPKDAVAHLAAKGAKITGSWREWLDGQHAQSFTVANVAKLDVLTYIQSSLTKALQKGMTLQQWKDGLISELKRKGWWQREGSTAQLKQAGRVDAQGEIAKGLTPHRLKTIFQTNMQQAYMAGRQAQMIEQAEERPYWQYVAILDGKTRPAHRALAGKVFRYDDAGWGSFFPPNGFNCVLPGTRVQGFIKSALKAFYSGVAVEISTANGHNLRVTANHPVLTARGWIASKDLVQGDQLITNSLKVNAGSFVIVDHNQTPALAEDVFEALSSQGFGITQVTPDDLHGDARFIDGDIHIAGEYSTLTRRSDAIESKLIEQGNLIDTHIGSGEQALRTKGAALSFTQTSESVDSQDSTNICIAATSDLGNLATAQQRILIERADALFELGVAFASSVPSGLHLTLNQRRVLFDRAPFDALGLTLSALLDASNAQDSLKRTAAEAEVFAQLIQAGAGAIARDEVISVSQFDWSGHIFDFQTENGLLMTGGILSHNCRCRVRNFNEREITQRKLDVGSTEGKLRKTEVQLKGGGTAQVTRLVDRSLPGGGFAPDAGFSNNPGALAWQPRLAAADVQLSRQYVDTAIAGPAFERFVKAGGQQAGAFPVARLRPQDQERLGTKAAVVYLSDATLAKQLKAHPELTLEDYRKLPDIIDDGEVLRDKEAPANALQSLIFLKQDDFWYRAAVKRTKSGEALFVTSLARLNADKAMAQMKAKIALGAARQ